jgi:hypothetical protein
MTASARASRLGTDPADAVPNGKLRRQAIKTDLDYIKPMKLLF